MKKAIIVASFGTSYEETRKLTLDTIEKEIKEKYTDYKVIRTYTSVMVRRILKKRDGIEVPSPSESVIELKNSGFNKIFIQPTHIIPGAEYEKLMGFSAFLGNPLLTEKTNMGEIVDALDFTPIKQDEAIVYMGHGSYHGADKFYEIIENKIRLRGLKNIFMGTVEGARKLEHIIPELKACKVKKIKLLPFMMVAGDHAINDMASEEDSSWNSILKRHGFKTEPILKGLGELPKIRQLIYKSLDELILKEGA